MVRLSQRTLTDVTPEVPVPGYDRSRLRPRIVHLGVGGFHRAHQAMYLDRLLAAGGDPGWSVCGIGTLPGDEAMRAALEPQDCLYTLVLKGTDGSVEPRVIGSIGSYLLAPADPERVVARLADPGTSIISLTITEGGYHVGESGFEPPASVTRDLAPGAVPATAFGMVSEAANRRWRAGGPGFTLMSCDNVPGNGEVAREAFTGFAAMRDPELSRWMDDHVAFPSSMVDRITPVTTDRDRAELADRFGVEDAWPVVSEPFTQWVLEDQFAAGRPPLGDVGVQVVADVRPYELMKLRLLNASHQVLGYLGYLAGFRFVHEVCLDPQFTAMILRYMTDEATPTLPHLPDTDVGAYRRTLLERFANPNIGDTLARNCTDGSDRIPKFVLPVVRDQLRAGGDITVAATACAAWARYLEGVDEEGRAIGVSDRRLAELAPLAARQRRDPDALLGVTDVFGDLGTEPRFVAAYRAALAALHERGARSVVDSLGGP